MKIKYIILNFLFVTIFATTAIGQIDYSEINYTSGKNVVHTFVPREAIFNLHDLNSKTFLTFLKK